ncbi:REPTOR-binding partner isoform X1 [Drosophila subobscura]|uniref:REPTOR-binding partner isoform X1 n=1 Tax=Drosophila subobscura TaxID=7241 RepID=UPI00155B3CC3|nr:REPTOR-binding partner isoform X1 [Drosophila subobscura]
MESQNNKMAVTEEAFPSTRKECGKRGRKPGRKTSSEKIDIKAKLERSRQSARECRARKKLRYQYLEELVADREKAVVALRAELERYILWSRQLNENLSATNTDQLLKEIGIIKQE